MIKVLSLSCLLFLLTPCFAQKKKKNTPNNRLETELGEIDKEFLAGFALKDLDNNTIVYEFNGDKSFVTGSNTKLFTLLGGLQILKDSIASFKYTISGDSLIIWPMADPTFLHPNFKKQPAFDKLKNSGKNIYLVSGGYSGNKYGKGWSWDNYNAGFQTEITDFPIYGNVVSYSLINGKANAFPDLEALYYAENQKYNGKHILRAIDNNNLEIPTDLPGGFKQKIPIVFSNSIKEGLLTDTILASGYATTSVYSISDRKMGEDVKTAFNTSCNTAFKSLLKDDDSLIGEHLLLNFSTVLGQKMDTETGISLATKHFNFSTDKLQWKDGSGLSPLNLASPLTIVSCLSQLKSITKEEQTLLSFFTKKTPSIYVQESHLLNTFNLSGYIIAKSGKKYAFSFLNNNVTDMERLKSKILPVLNLINEGY